ncbi:PepSY-associated TM helix domain-containing protein [Methylomonas rivi]|uniref:PepSY domain-containing protein n=1 Tax=Methylomonas rivi TaxID=2952226 RepID=A0ABT1U9V0_9GAMM|nr:PepSY-associated TM helix domain-containing protein [Methylomonas sp. WSC-6]MCQ8130637.1 PepSY domain-containing protein [Methylomonas sp. WSC-6]
MGYQRKSLRQFWLNVHLCIALSFGFIFVIFGLTGSINIFHWELEELDLPEVRHERYEKPLALDSIMEKVRKRHPSRQGQWNLYMPGYERDYLWLWYPKPEEYAGRLFKPFGVVVNPYTGDLVEEHFWGETVWTFVYQLHATLLAARYFEADNARVVAKIVSILGLFFMASILSGLYLWWPSSGRFGQAIRFKRKAGSARLIYDVHKLTGLSCMVVLFLTAFTGFSFRYKDFLKPIVSQFSIVNSIHHQDPKDLKSNPKAGRQPISIKEAIAIADSVFPYAELRWLATPKGLEGVYAVEKKQAGEANSRRPRSKVWIDQYDGRVLAVEDPNLFTAGETFFNLIWPLHNGEALGLPGRIIWCMIGLAPLLLYVTGILRWLQKRQAKRLKSS